MNGRTSMRITVGFFFKGLDLRLFYTWQTLKTYLAGLRCFRNSDTEMIVLMMNVKDNTLNETPLR